MKKYNTIYLDQDGVLASFTKSVIKQLNDVTGDNITIHQAIEKSNWDLENLWGMSQKEWWNAIDQNPNFWLEIEPFPWAKQLYKNLKKHADEVIILTSPSQSEHCIPHKIKWLQKHLSISKNNIIPAKKKYLMAKKGTLLIDDAPHNVSKFIHNGGHAILVPSDWNEKNLNYETVWSIIDQYLNLYPYQRELLNGLI